MITYYLSLVCVRRNLYKGWLPERSPTLVWQPWHVRRRESDLNPLSYLLVSRRYLVPSKLKSLQLCTDRASKTVRRRRVRTIGRAVIDSGRT